MQRISLFCRMLQIVDALDYFLLIVRLCVSPWPKASVFGHSNKLVLSAEKSSHFLRSIAQGFWPGHCQLTLSVCSCSNDCRSPKIVRVEGKFMDCRCIDTPAK